MSVISEFGIDLKFEAIPCYNKFEKGIECKYFF